MMTPGNTYAIEAQIKSPMGWIKVQVSLTLLSDTSFSGHAKLLGSTVELTDCEKNGSHFHFTASPKLPFGVLRVEADTDMAEDGSLTGVARAPRHKPMEIKGQLEPAAVTAP